MTSKNLYIISEETYKHYLSKASNFKEFRPRNGNLMAHMERKGTKPAELFFLEKEDYGTYFRNIVKGNWTEIHFNVI